MAANRFNGFSNLSIGVGLRAQHYPYVLHNKPQGLWFEIISENFMIGGGRPLAILDEVLETYNVIQHGVSLYLGSTDRLNRDHLKKLKELTQRTKTPWLSDHLCWGSVDGTYAHDLLPLPYTKEAVKVVAEKIRMVQDFIELPFAVENLSSYAEFFDSQMTEWQFLSEVSEAADCGILLDVNNVYVSSRNHNFDPYTYLNAIPKERVAQIHLAGHSTYDNYLLDTHDHPVSSPVWELYGHTIKQIGPTPTLLEWDDRIPSFEETLAEANKAQKFLAPTEHHHAPV